MKLFLLIFFVLSIPTAYSSSELSVGTKISSSDTYHMSSMEFLDLRLDENNLYGSSWSFSFSPSVIKEHSTSTTVTLNQLRLQKLLLKNKAAFSIGRDETWLFSEMLTRDGAEFTHYSYDYQKSYRLDAGRIVNKEQLNDQELEILFRASYFDRSLVDDLSIGIEILNYDSEFGGKLSSVYKFSDRYRLNAHLGALGKSNNSYSFRFFRNYSFIELKRSLKRIVSNDDEDTAYRKIFKVGEDSYIVLNMYEFDGVAQASFVGSMADDEKYKFYAASKLGIYSPHFTHSRNNGDRQDILGLVIRIRENTKIDFGEGRIKTIKRRSEEVFKYIELSHISFINKVHRVKLSSSYLDSDEWIHNDIRVSCSYTRKY